MNQKSQAESSDDPASNPQFWKVEPGLGLGLFRLGMPRGEVFDLLRQQNFETCEDDLDDSELYVMEMDVTLYFSKQSPYPVLLIEAEDERVRFGTLTVLWQYVHNFFSTVAATDTLWFDDFNLITDPHSTPAIKTDPSDEHLLENGTVWIAPLGVGFGLSSARIIAVYLCDPTNLPTTGHGQFTGAQRHLSEKLQIASYKAPVSNTHPLESLLKLGLLITAVLVAAFFAKRAWDEQKRWTMLPKLKLKLSPFGLHLQNHFLKSISLDTAITLASNMK